MTGLCKLHRLCTEADEELGVSQTQRRVSSSLEAEFEWFCGSPGSEVSQAIEFTQNFQDLIEGEIFVQALTGSVKVKSFRHPGTTPLAA